MRAFAPLPGLVLVAAGVGHVPPAVADDAVTEVFSYNGTDGTDGSQQTWIAPSGVYSASFELLGASGSAATQGAAGGQGASLTAVIPVEPGVEYAINVGGAPPESSRVGGFNGGGAGDAATDGWGPVGAGGGATDVRTTTDGHRILVAGGGGGGGGASSITAGGIGGDAGSDGAVGWGVMTDVLAPGGTPGRAGCTEAFAADCSKGGVLGGHDGSSSGMGGDFGVPSTRFVGRGGAGGGGYYGGGSGGAGQSVGWGFAGGGGGGGGSNYVPSDALSTAVTVRSAPGHGEVAVTYVVGDFDGDQLVETDRCPNVFSPRADGCPAIGGVMSLSYRQTGGVFRGRITGPAAACLVERNVTLWRVRKGPDRRVGAAMTGPDGRYFIRRKAERGRTYYAISRRVLAPTTGICVRVTTSFVRP